MTGICGEANDMYTLDEGVVESGIVLFLLAEDSAAKLKRGQLNVYSEYVYCVRCTLFPLTAEICARFAGNFCQ